MKGAIMKKLLVIVAMMLMLPVSAMAGMTAFMDMDELSNNELAQTTGQVGITVLTNIGSVTGTGGYISWGDSNGCAGCGTTAGWLNLTTLSFSVATGTEIGMTIDACTTSAGVSYLVLGISAGSITTDLDIQHMRVGSAVGNIGADMGELVVDNLMVNVGSTITLKIAGH